MKIKHSELRELIQETLSERDNAAEAALLNLKNIISPLFSVPLRIARMWELGGHSRELSGAKLDEPILVTAYNDDDDVRELDPEEVFGREWLLQHRLGRINKYNPAGKAFHQTFKLINHLINQRIRDMNPYSISISDIRKMPGGDEFIKQFMPANVKISSYRESADSYLALVYANKQAYEDAIIISADAHVLYTHNFDYDMHEDNLTFNEAMHVKNLSDLKTHFLLDIISIARALSKDSRRNKILKYLRKKIEEK